MDYSWKPSDTEKLIQFTEDIDYDNIKCKEQIKKTLLNNRFIIHALHNEDLERIQASPDKYFNKSIYPYYLIPDIQSGVKNFLCYEVGYDELNRWNDVIKVLQVTFHILCYKDDIIDEDTSVCRHDLIAALVQDQFNFTNFLGPKIKLVSDKPGTTDNDYVLRTLIFEQTTDNNLVKSRTVNGMRVPIISNKVQTYPSEQN